MKRRNWQLTLNQPELYKKLSDYLKSINSLQYLVSCEETAPTTGHKHIHVFVHFKNSIKLNLKKCCNAHIEPCYGSVDENILYIKKLENEDDKILEEIGEKPKEKEKVTIKKLKEMSQEEREELSAFYYNIVMRVKEEEVFQIKTEDFYKKVKVFYIWGESGIGKTKLSIEIINYIKIIKKDKKYEIFNNVKFINNFWIGVSNALIALYDDFRDNHMKPSEFINFIDYAKHTMNIKYGSIKNEYEYIIITSIQDPDELYRNYIGTDMEQKTQWIRRIEIIHLKHKNEYKKFNYIDLFK